MADVDNAAVPPEKPTPPLLPPQAPTWSEPVFRAGLYVGVGLLVAGLITQSLFLVPYIVSLLVICSGLGIVFGAFGSLAVIQYKGAVIAGVATIAIALLWLTVQLGDSLLRIRLDGDVKGAKVVLSGDDVYPGADRVTSVEFYVVTQSIDVDRLALLITLPSTTNTDGTVTPGGEVNFECIPADSIRQFLGSGRPLQWRFDSRRRQIRGQGLPNGAVPDGPCDRDAGPAIAGLQPAVFSPVTPAFAQEQPIEALLADLDSDSTVVRRDARHALALLGTAAIRPMMDHWSKNPNNYSVKLGVAVALTHFLRDNKDAGKSVSELLTPDDLMLIAAAVGDEDRTLRIYATEFLYDLGDPRILELADRIFTAASEDGKYNLLVAISGAVSNLSEADKAKLRQTLIAWLSGVGSKTKVKIEEIMASLQA